MTNEQLQQHVSYLFNHLNNIKRSYILLVDCKYGTTTEHELNIFKGLSKLELQIRNMQKDIKEKGEI